MHDHRSHHLSAYVCSYWVNGVAHFGEIHLTKHVLCFHTRKKNIVRMVIPFLNIVGVQDMTAVEAMHGTISGEEEAEREGHVGVGEQGVACCGVGGSPSGASGGSSPSIVESGGGADPSPVPPRIEAVVDQPPRLSPASFAPPPPPKETIRINLRHTTVRAQHYGRT